MPRYQEYEAQLEAPSSPSAQDYYPQDSPTQDLFSRANDLKVIQEYNDEQKMPQGVKHDFWSLASKSVKLGFWNESDLAEIYLHKNLIKVGHIMAKPKFRYTFKERQEMNQMDFLVYADFKRGVGMEKYKINERTLQATSVTQSIQGSGAGSKKGGVGGFLSKFFN